jgi:hypothetical protein
MASSISSGGELSGTLTKPQAQVEGGNVTPVLVETTIANTQAQGAALVADTVTPTLLIASTRPLAGRKYIVIRNTGTGSLLYGPLGIDGLLDPGATDIVYKRQTKSVDVGPDVSLFILAESGNGTFALQEYA